MGRGKPWTDEENELLLKMSEEGRSAQEIYDSHKFPGRTVRAIEMQIKRLSIVSQKENFIVTQITPVDISHIWIQIEK